jgi:hypothetical protein
MSDYQEHRLPHFAKMAWELDSLARANTICHTASGCLVTIIRRYYQQMWRKEVTRKELQNVSLELLSRSTPALLRKIGGSVDPATGKLRHQCVIGLKYDTAARADLRLGPAYGACLKLHVAHNDQLDFPVLDGCVVRKYHPSNHKGCEDQVWVDLEHPSEHFSSIMAHIARARLRLLYVLYCRERKRVDFISVRDSARPRSEAPPEEKGGRAAAHFGRFMEEHYRPADVFEICFEAARPVIAARRPARHSTRGYKASRRRGKL